MVTHSELVTALQDMGHGDLDRRVRYWRDNGVLPPLLVASRGPDHGIERYWQHEDVIDQAILANWLSDGHTRLDAVVVRLWWAGFAVESENARRAWLGDIDQRRSKIDTASRKRAGGLSAILDRWTKKLLKSTRRAKTTKAPKATVRRVLSRFLEAAYDPNYEPDLEGDFYDVVEFLGAADQMLDGAFSPDNWLAQVLEGFLAAIHAAKPDAMREFLPTLTASEMAETSRFLYNLRMATTDALCTANPDAGPEFHALLHMPFAEMLAPILTVAHVSAQRDGSAEHLERAVAVLRSELTALFRNIGGLPLERVKESPSFRRRLCSALARIWSDREPGLVEKASVYLDGPPNEYC